MLPEVVVLSRKLVVVIFALLLGSAAVFGQTESTAEGYGHDHRQHLTPVSSVGLPLGAHIPPIDALDQDGITRDFSSVVGPNGAVVYFFRSAGWCIYCRAQLVEIEAAATELRNRGFGIVGISYDPISVLREFATEKSLSFPLLSDPDSKIIREFEILDATVLPGEPAYGVPYHGSYIVDAGGVVLEKHFDADSVLNHSSGVVVTRLYGSPYGTHEKVVRHQRLTLAYSAADEEVAPGSAVELRIDVKLHEGIHVYAPSTARVIPITWKIEPSQYFAISPAALPAPERLHLGSESDVDIYRGEFGLRREVELSADLGTLAGALDPQGRLLVEGSFEFQACDDRQCFLPTVIPLTWALRVTGTTAKGGS